MKSLGTGGVSDAEGGVSDTDPVVCTTIAGLPVTAEREAWAHLQLAYIGWREGDAQYRDALMRPDAAGQRGGSLRRGNCLPR